MLLGAVASVGDWPINVQPFEAITRSRSLGGRRGGGRRLDVRLFLRKSSPLFLVSVAGVRNDKATPERSFQGRA